jgi:hypothetical protein
MTNRGVCAYLSAVTKWSQSLSRTSGASTFSEGYKHTSVYVTSPAVAAGVRLGLLEGKEGVHSVKSLRLTVENPGGARRFAKTAPAAGCPGGC